MLRLSIAVLAASLALASAANARPIGLGTNPQGSIAYAAASAIGKVVEEKTDLQARVIPQGGPEILIPLTLQGEFDVTFANTVAANFAYQGLDSFPQAMTGLRAVIAVFPLRLGLYVRQDSGIDTAADLKGRRIAWGYTQQRNLQAFTEAYLAAAGLGEADIDPVPVPSGARGVADFKEGKVDAVLFSLTAGLAKEADAAVGGMKILPFPQDAKGEAAIAAKSPGAVVEVLQPAPAFAGVRTPTAVLETPLVMLASANADDAMVRKLAETVLDNHAELAAAVAAFRGFDPQNPAPRFGVPYHPAAEALFKERGLWK